MSKLICSPVCAPSDLKMAQRVHAMLLETFPICRDAKLELTTAAVAKENGMWVSEYTPSDAPHFVITGERFLEYTTTWDSVRNCASDWMTGYQAALRDIQGGTV